MLFAILSEPLKKTEAVQRIANFFGITHLQAEDLLSPFLKKEGILAGDYGNSSSYFPKSIIREYTEQESKDFFTINLKTKSLHTILQILNLQI
ncbi:MAG: hypothetical protein NC453_00030 [Muribaculum sp.]|nr:hypothetical protein [Muribaculum sp.]